MRQSEREALLTQLAGRLFAGAREVLHVGEGSAVGVPGPAWSAARRYDAALWRLPAELSALEPGLPFLRAALRPGAALLLVAPRRPPLLRKLKAALGGEPAPRPALEPLCRALLLAGFLGPRVHELLPSHFVVSATLAALANPLDAFFEQPLATLDR